MNTAPEWLDKEIVLEIHTEVISRDGGSEGLRDEGLLESALSRPVNLHFYIGGSIFELAACYVEGIARNHAFVDGNKRTALVASVTFLELNGYELNADQTQLEDIVVELAEGKISREDMAVFFEKNCKKMEDSEF